MPMDINVNLSFADSVSGLTLRPRCTDCIHVENALINILGLAAA